MRRTMVEIDEELLATAQELLETKTIKDTVNEALRLVYQRRLAALESELIRSTKLGDPEIMKGAWR